MLRREKLCGTGSAGPHEPSPPKQALAAPSWQPPNPGDPQRCRSSGVPEAGAKGETPRAAAEAGYVLAGGVDFCCVEEINAVVVG